MRRTAFLLAGLVVCGAVAAPVPKEQERKLGPEWVKDKDGKDYVRKLELTTVANGGPSGNLYTHLPLEDYKRDLYVTESLDWRGKTLAVRLSGEANPPGRGKDDTFKYSHPNKMALEVERTERKDGQAAQHIVQLGKCRYYDLDGDGRFDAMVDQRDKEKELSYVLISQPDGELESVRIKTLARSLNVLPVRLAAYHTDTVYVFEKWNWRVWTAEDKRKWEAGGKDKDK